MVIHLSVVYEGVRTTTAELNICDRDHMASISQVFIIWPFIEKVCCLLNQDHTGLTRGV